MNTLEGSATVHSFRIFQHSDEWQIAVAFRVIQSVADDKMIGNLKPR